MLLEGRNILICGASGLIGQAIVESCVQEGATVTGISRSANFDEIDLNSATFFPLEISLKNRAEFIDTLNSADTPFDGAVNCLGKWWGPGSLSDMTNSELEDHIQSSIAGPLIIYSALKEFLAKIEALFSFVQVNGVGAAKDIPGATAVAASDAYVDRLFTGESSELSFHNIEMTQLAIHGTVSKSGENANFSASQIGRAVTCLLSRQKQANLHGRTFVLSQRFQLKQLEPKKSN